MTDGTSDPRLDSFRSKKVKHAMFESVMDEVIQLVEHPRPESVVVLLGPSGVGKSTVIEAVEKHLRRKYASDVVGDPGFIPYLSIRAHTPLDGHFNWKDFFTRALMAGGEILLSRKVIPSFEIDLDGKKVDLLKSLVREELRRSLESMVRFRRIKVILLDEASSILYMKSGQRPTLQFDILKSLAVELRIPILLVGAYDLLGILDGAGQLLRRSHVIHFRRYVANGSVRGDSDVSHFLDTLNALLKAMDVQQDANLCDYVEFFMAKSAGCVGVLKDWLDRSMVKTLASKSGRLTSSILEHEALSNATLIRLVEEARSGEARLTDVTDEELARALNLPYTPSLDFSSTQPAEAPKRKKPHPPGLRGPSRDPVGELT